MDAGDRFADYRDHYEQPEVLVALRILAELKEALGATEREKDWPHRLAYVTPTGAEIVCHPMAARVMVRGDGYFCDVTVCADRIAIAYAGDHSAETFTLMLLIDFLHETGQLPTDTTRLSAAQLADLAGLRSQFEEETHAA